jgi:catechol 2,3-dioxygenase-like lactoylglutathione lyase family enzyme
MARPWRRRAVRWRRRKHVASEHGRSWQDYSHHLHEVDCPRPPHLTVTDIARSRRFYDAVFGWPVLLEIPEGADEATRQQLGFTYSGVIYNIGNALIGLHPVATDTVHEDRSGWDHIAFPVANRAELDAAAAHLEQTQHCTPQRLGCVVRVHNCTVP